MTLPFLFWMLIHLVLSISLLVYRKDLCNSGNASGDYFPPFCPAATLSLPWTGPLRLAVWPAEQLFWRPAGRHHRRRVSLWVWLPTVLSCCHVLWWTKPDSHASHPLPYEVFVSPKQCHQSHTWLSSGQCNQSAVAHDAPQPADIWCHWREGTSGPSQTQTHTNSEHDAIRLV